MAAKSKNGTNFVEFSLESLYTLYKMACLLVSEYDNLARANEHTYTIEYNDAKEKLKKYDNYKKTILIEIESRLNSLM